MYKSAYTNQEIAVLLGISPQAVWQRAKKEGWESRPRKGRGGGKEWLLSSMPESTRLAIRTAEERQALAVYEDTTPAPFDGITVAGTVNPGLLDESRRLKALARDDLVRLYLDWQRKHGKTVEQTESFVIAYLGGVWPELLAKLGRKISWKTIERWKLEQAKADSVLALVDRRGLAHRGRSNLTQNHMTIILGTVLNPNAPYISACVREVQKKCVATGLYEPSDATIRRFVKAYTAECYDEWTFFREGKKAWNDKCAISILRDWDLVEVGDVVIADGHTLNFETLDPETGKPKRMTLLLFYDGASNCPIGWEVMATENTACISSAFRRACITLGKIPRVIYLDNGKAFRSKFFKGTSDFQQAGILGLYESLGCSVIHAWPYHGQSKTIERFFGTFHEMEILTPSYTGNSIAAKPARMHRGETMHRKLYEKMGGRPLTLEETHIAIAQWFGEYVHRPQYRSHLKGKTPREVFEMGIGPGVDVERLTLLMLQKEIRTITKDGIKLLGRLYWHEALSSRRHPVLVRYDNVFAPHTVLVYDLDGHFLCEARDREHYKIAYGVHPAASVLGTLEQQEDLSAAIQLKKGQERLAGANVKVMLDEVVLPEARKQVALQQQPAKILPMPQNRETALSKEEEASIEAAKAQVCAEIDTKNSSKSNYAPSWKKRFRDEMERYEYLFFVIHEEGQQLDEKDAIWASKYEKSTFFQDHLKPRYDQLLELFEFRKSASAI